MIKDERVKKQLQKEICTGKLVWENPDVTKEFSHQNTTEFDGAPYSYYDIIFVQDNVSLKTQRVYVNADISYRLENVYGGYIRTRSVRAYNNYIYFGDGAIFSTYGKSTSNNNQCVPAQIIAYK